MSDNQMMVIDLTQDEPVITYIDRPAPTPRRALADITQELDACRNRGQPRVVSSRRHRRSRTNDPENIRPTTATQGNGVKRTPNPWISHVKAFAEKNNMKYWEALKNPATKKAYSKVGGKFSFKNLGKSLAKPFEIGGVNPFEAGYDVGYNTIGPAIAGK